MWGCKGSQCFRRVSPLEVPGVVGKTKILCRRASPAPCSLLPAPCSLLPAPCSLLPSLCSLLPSPCSLLPSPFSLLPSPYSLLPTPFSLLLLTRVPQTQYPYPCLHEPTLTFCNVQHVQSVLLLPLRRFGGRLCQEHPQPGIEVVHLS